jgi:hypothetical protein
MTESSNSASDSIIFNVAFLKPLTDYLIALGIVQSSIVNTFQIGMGIFGVVFYWRYFLLSVYMAKKIPPKGVIGSLFCYVIGSVLAALISTYGKRFV